MAVESASVSPSPIASGASRASWLVWGATSLMCALVVARVPLWGTTAWGTHSPVNLVGNLPLLVLLGLLFWIHARWMKSLDNARPSHVGRVAVLCGLALALGLGARLGENAGWGRFALVTVNPASGGFFEAAYDSQNDANWIANYPALMKKYHHVHSHPPMPVGVMRWFLARRSPALVEATDNLLAISPGTNSAALAQFAGNIWKRPYSAPDVAAAFWGGILWLACALLVPACTYVSANALFGPRAGAQSGLLSCVVPSLLLFVPGADLSYVAFAALALCLGVLGSQKSSPLLLLSSGVVAAMGVTGTFAGVWAVILTCAFLVFRAHNDSRARLKQALILGSAALLTLGLLQLMGMNWLLFWRSLIAFNVDADVQPVLRFAFHLADFFTFFGVALSVVLFWGVSRAWKARRENGEDATQNRDILALALPVLGVLLLLNTVISMAETARIWMLFTPPLLVAIGGILERSQSPSLSRAVLAAQLVQAWVFVVFLNVWSF